jgi:hypothetical protein
MTKSGRPAEAAFLFRGGTYTITELAAHPECRCKRPTLETRLRAGWTAERAVTTPKMGASAAGRRARLNPNVAVYIAPRRDPMWRNV